MNPKFRAWMKDIEAMAEVYSINFLSRKVNLVISGVGWIKHFSDIILMQSTGLVDSRPEPVEIHKDDIVKRTSLIPGGSDLVGIVKMLEGCWVIDDGKQAVPLWTEVDENIVLGNIHEHPDLVEVGND